MNDNEILQEQIARQIEGEIRIDIQFAEGYEDPLKLYFQECNILIKPLFGKTKMIGKKLAQELLDLIGLNVENLKTEDFAKTYRLSNIKYDDFFNKFYNNI